ncbi:unnamed protein product [Paramecium sonneborni]|uniref:TLDc domain-containing protein n=1 Tax=Paramecium sonneborni TaxID=65129 RepID=A0A8S1NLV1_9CILI|nr:unnamed protein product [Paramecium sonneborni]CAD8093588.1 unnamed protein product [Paramecium sonneborni]
MDKENLLMIFKSQSGNIFGAYTPLKWIYVDKYITDPSCNSFLFSYTHKSIHQNKKDEIALDIRRDDGPRFSVDLNLDGDFENGY